MENTLKLCKFGATLTDDEINFVKSGNTSVLEEARTFYGKENYFHIYLYIFLHSAAVPQQHLWIKTSEAAVQIVLLCLGLTHPYQVNKYSISLVENTYGNNSYYEIKVTFLVN